MVEVDSAKEFQVVIGRFIEKMGFQIESSRLLDDGSVDFRAQTTNPLGGKVLSLIRASAYSRPVNQADVTSLKSSMDEIEAVRAAYITTSGFSDDAVESAKDKPISLINKYQLMESLERRGLLEDKALMESLDKYGLGEYHFQGAEQSFAVGRSDSEAKAFFESKGGKGERPAKISIRYSPVSVLKMVTLKEIYTEDQTLRTLEKKDYLFVNLYNLDLYYVLQKRRWGSTEKVLLRTDILKKIFELPEASREYLIHLLDHGDLPVEDLEGKNLSILKNKKVIEIYEGKRYGTDLMDYIKLINDELSEWLKVIVYELTNAFTDTNYSVSGGGGKDAEAAQAKKKVRADVPMPHSGGGVYDIWKHLDTASGLVAEGEIDTLRYSSKDVSKILSSIMKGKARSEGIIFMPYYRAKFVDSRGEVVKYEVLIAPKFKGEKGESKDGATKPSAKIRRKPLAGEFKLIK